MAPLLLPFAHVLGFVPLPGGCVWIAAAW